MKKIISKFKKLLFYIFIGYPLYGLSFVFKRNSDIWVISGPFGFRDNSKYFAIYLFESQLDFKFYWVAKTKEEMLYIQQLGIPVVLKWSMRGVYYCLRAKVYIFDSYVSDINLWVSGGAIKCNLWHGIGIKNIERKARVGVTKKIFSGNKYIKSFIYPAHHIKPDIFLSTSPLMTQHFSESFGININNCIEAIYPRCQIFMWTNDRLRSYIKKYEPDDTVLFINKIQEYEHRYIYMPTWRDNNNEFLDTANIDLCKLNEIMVESNSIFIFKLHPNTKLDINLSQFKNLSILPNTLDVYPILPYIDTLITDYSSIYYDFILMQEKNVILFPFDYDSYVSEDRDLAYPYLEYTRGELAYSFNELLEKMSNRNTVSTSDIRKLFWSDSQNNCEYIKKYITSIAMIKS